MSINNSKFSNSGVSHLAVTYQCFSRTELENLPEIRAYIKENFPDHKVIVEELHVQQERDQGRFWIIKPAPKDV